MKKQRIDMLSSEFQPRTEYVLVEPLNVKKEEKTESGIVLALEEDPMARPTHGTVQAVGSDITDVKVNQEVIWPNTDGLDLEFNDGHRVLLRYKSVIGMRKV